MSLFLDRVRIAAANSVRHWSSPITDSAASRVWMVVEGHDIPVEAAERIVRAETGKEETRRIDLAEAYWITYAPQFPVMQYAASRLVVAGPIAIKHLSERLHINASQVFMSDDLTFPLSVRDQSRITGEHTGFFDEVVAVWPFPSSFVQMLDYVMPGTTMTTVCPSHEHNGWLGWADFEHESTFVQALANEKRFKIAKIRDSANAGVRTICYGFEAV